MSDVLGWFNSMKKGFIDMVGSENRRSKIYASCSEVLRKLATCGSWVGGFKENHTLCGCIKGLEATNKLQRRCLEVKKQEPTYESQVVSLKCNKWCNRDVSREWNEWGKGCSILLYALTHEQRSGWGLCTMYQVKSQQKMYVLMYLEAQLTWERCRWYI